MTTQISEYSKTEAALADLKSRYAGVEFEIATTAGMNSAKAARAELRGYRVNLEKKRKEIKAPALERCNLIDTEARRITAALLELEDPIDELIKQEEARKDAERAERARQEAARIAAIRAKIDAIRSAPLNLLGKSAQEIAIAFTAADEMDVSEFAGFEQTEAIKAKQDAIEKLREMWTQQVAHESEQQRLRAEREELDRQRKEQMEKLYEQDRLAKIERDRKEAEWHAKLAEEDKAREAEEARQQAERKEADRLRLEQDRLARDQRERDDAEAERVRKEKEAELRREREAFEAQKAKDAQDRLEKELAEITLLGAAQEAYQFLVSKGFEKFPVAVKLKVAISKEAPAPIQAAA